MVCSSPTLLLDRFPLYQSFFSREMSIILVEHILNCFSYDLMNKLCSNVLLEFGFILEIQKPFLRHPTPSSTCQAHRAQRTASAIVSSPLPSRQLASNPAAPSTTTHSERVAPWPWHPQRQDAPRVVACSFCILSSRIYLRRSCDMTCQTRMSCRMRMRIFRCWSSHLGNSKVNIF